jgi:hypothetical protein
MRIITPAIYAALLGGAIYLAIAQNPLPNAVASVSPEAPRSPTRCRPTASRRRSCGWASVKPAVRR